MSRQPTIIYSADNPQQAHLLRSLLADEGIQAWVLNDAIQMAGGELPVGWRGAAKVAVGDDDAVAAHEFAEAFDHRAHQHFLDDPDEDASYEQSNSRAETPVWPVCPTCGEPRSARCPICGESGVRFPAGDGPDPTAKESMLFICPACDDPIVPEWYRLCARCAYDFGTGLDVQQPQQTRPDISPRTIIVLIVLLSLAAAMATYFWWLFVGQSQ